MPEVNLNIDPTNYKVVSGKTWSITGLRVDNNFSSRCIFNDSTTESASGYYSSELGDNVSTGVYSTSGQFDNPDLRVSWNLIHPRGNQILGTEALRDPFFKSYEINIRNIDGTFKSGINFINNGSITAVDLISGGSGYINPTVFVSGDGTGAAIEVKTLGTGTFSALSGFSNIGFSGYATGIQSVNVVSGGSGYTAANTKLVVSGEGNDAHTIGDMALPVQGGDGITTVGSGALVEVAATGFGIREGYYLQNYIDIPYDLNKDIFGGEGQRKFMVEVITNDFYDHTSTGRIIVDFPEPEFESVNILDTKRGLSFGVTPKTGQVFENKIFEDASLEKIEIHKSTTSDFLVNTGEVFTSTLFHTFRPDNKNGEGKLSSLSEIDVPSEKFVEQDFFSGYFYKLVPYDKFGTGQILDIGTGIRIEKNIDPVDIPSGFRLITDEDKTVGTNIQGEVVTNTYLSWKKDIKFNTNQYEVTIEDDVEKDSYSITLNPPQISGIDFFISGTGANRADFDEKSAVQVGPEGMANDAFDIFAPYSTDGIQWVDHTVFLDSEYLATVSDSISNVEFVEVPAGNISSGYLYFTGLDGKHINYAGSNSFSLSTDNEEPHALVARNVNNEVIVEYEPRIKIPTKKDGSYNFKVRGINKLGEKSNYSNIVNFTASGAPSHFNFDPLDTSLKLGGTGTISKSGPFVTTVGGSGISAAGTGVVAVGGVNNTVTGEFSALVGGSGNQLLGGIGNPAESSFLGGGRGNYVSGNRNALVGGHFNLVSGDGQSLLGGANNILFGSSQDRTSGENQIGNEEAFGFENSAIVGGQINTVSGRINFIGGGDRNVIGLQLNRPATINGGPIEATDIDTVHKISSLNVLGSAIVGGSENQIFGNYNFIGGGLNNRIFEGSNLQKGAYSAILGGQDNTITGTSTQGTSIIGGKDNVGAGLNSIIGGLQSTGEGAYSLAIGSYGWANHDGSFVLADGTQPAKVEGHRGHKKSLTTHSLNLFFENGTYVRNGDLYVSGDATVTGNLTVLGSFTLGDTTTDTLTSVGEIVTNDFVSGLSGYFGKVGIGSSTIDEDAVLQVTKPDVADPSRTEVARFLAITDAGNTNSSLRISSAVAGSQTSGRYVDLSVFDHNPTSRPLILQRDGGQVGIGTSIPDGAMLKVNGDASITGELKVNDEVHISNNLVHKGDTDTFLNFNADRIRLNAGGVELIDAREAGTDYVAIGGLDDNGDVNFIVNSAVNGIDRVLEIDAGTSTVGINCDPLDAKGSALVVSGDASITGELRANGNLGVGAASPVDSQVKIFASEGTVFDASQASHQRSEGATLTIYNGDDTVGSFSQILLRNRASSVGGCRIASLADGANNSVFRLSVGDTTEAFSINGDGEALFGEGQDQAGAKLTVSGDASITGALRVAGQITTDVDVVARDVYISEQLIHAGDTDTDIAFTSDRIKFNAGGVELIDAREAGTDYVAIGGLDDNPDVNLLVGSAVNGIDFVLEVDAGSSTVGINCDPLDAKGAALVVSGDASITGELKVAGNVGIGASAPTSSIEVNGAAGTTFEFTDADGRSLTDLGGGILSWNAAAVLGSASWGGTADIEIDQVANSTRDILNVGDKFDVSPIKNQIRLRDNVFISGDVEVSGDIAAITSGIVADEGGYVSGTSGFFGKVGIGTTSIEGDARLTVQLGSADGTYFRGGGHGSSAHQRQLKISSSTTNNAGDTHTFDAESSFGEIAFASHGTEALRMDSNGHIGIGVTTPQATLQVNGDASITGETRIAGNVGIGAAPSFKLQVDGTVRVNNGDFFLDDGDFLRWGGTDAKIEGSSGGDRLAFYTDGSERVRFAGSNVGIGTTTPQAKLQVNGDVSITGDLRVGDGTDKFAVNAAPDATITAQSHANNENVFDLRTDHGKALFSVRQSADAALIRAYKTNGASSQTQTIQLDADSVSFITGGNLAVGTTTSDNALSIVMPAADSSNLFDASISDTNAALSVFKAFNNGSDDSDVEIGKFGVARSAFGASNDWAGHFKFHTHGGVTTADFGAERFRLTWDGNGRGYFGVNNDKTVGVYAADNKVQITSDGTQNVAPQATLVVSGDASITGELRVNSDIVIPQDKYLYLEGDTDDALNRIGRNNSENAILTTSRFHIANIIDSNNDDTNAEFSIRHNGTTIAGSTSLFSVNAGGTSAFNGNLGITGELRVDDAIISTSTVDCTSLGLTTAIVHDGDSDTKITFDADRVQLLAGGQTMFDAREAGADYFAVGGIEGDDKDVNFVVNAAKDAVDYALWVDAGNANVGIGGVHGSSIEATLQVSGNASITGELRTNGSVGIGTAPNSSAKLESYITSGGEKALRLNTNFAGGNTVDFIPAVVGVSNAGFSIDLAESTKFVINDGGNVGIGTKNASAKLHLYDTSEGPNIIAQTTANDLIDVNLNANRSSADSTLSRINAQWNGTTVSQINFIAGDDNTNKDDGEMSFKVAQGGSLSEAIRITQDGNVGIGTANPSTKLQVDGSFSATTKSFLINHPNPEKNLKGDKLQYASLEGPEHGVYVRGKANSKIIELPDYWIDLIDEESISIQLTPIKNYQELYVESIKDNKILIKNNKDNKINCFYTVYAERKDVDKLKVELTSVNN